MLGKDDIGRDAAGGNSPMARALDEAAAAGGGGEVPVGAVLVDNTGIIIAAAGNRVERDHDPTAHAEMLVLRAGAAQPRRSPWPISAGCILAPTMRKAAASSTARASSSSRPAIIARRFTAASPSAPRLSCCAGFSRRGVSRITADGGMRFAFPPYDPAAKM